MGVDEHTIEVAGAPVFYRRAPATGATALYLHSVPTSSDDWREFLPRTGGLAPDLIGFGRSAKGGHLDYSLNGYVGFLEALFTVLDLDRVAIVGHGWGAAIGLLFAERHPERVVRIAIIDGVPLLPGLSWPRMVRYWRRPAVGELLMGSVNRWLLARTLRAGTTRPQSAWPDARVDEVWEQFDQGTQRAILRLHRSIDAAGLAQVGRELSSLESPALVLWGDADPWLDPSFAAAYAARLPHAGAELIAGAGHWPWLDRPEVIDRIASFLTPAELA
ncbi:MAG TPA: alpha/beta fold hydrolase [Solirubrobacteraceae bacterium]